VSAYRRPLLAVAVPGGLAALWLHLLTLQAGDMSAPGDGQPELYMEQPQWRSFDRNGLLVRELAAARLEKWPGDSQARLNEPRLQLVDSRQQHWHVEARLGWLDEDRQQLRLERQVRLEREPRRGGLVVTTQALQIGERDGLIETDQAVVLDSGNWHFTATGMRAELGRQQLQLLGNVRGTHD
jgi:LPS export ABC transporter protein LptC